MYQRFAIRLSLFSLLTATVFAQGLNTTASKDDWEEINFEFNSAILSDGYPSLLRLADLLKAHPDYKVKIEGNTDWVGSNRYNERLGERRADEVKRFLVKYGANESQLTTASLGKRNPKVDNHSKEGRFMNRRVMLTVTDGQGRTISAGTIGEAIQAMQPGANFQKCCDDILKRLDRLDEIANALRDLGNANAKMQSDLDALRKENADLRNQLGAVASAVTAGFDAIARNELDRLKRENDALRAHLSEPKGLLGSGTGPTGPVGGTTTTATATAGPGGTATASTTTTTGSGFGPLQPDIDKLNRENDELSTRRVGMSSGRRFTLLGMNVGADDNGKLTFTGKGRFFDPFKENFAVQAQAEYLYFRNQKEGQFDLGLVSRVQNFQAGLFSSFKYVSLSGNQSGGGLGQGALTLDYIFPLGRVGLFGTKGFKNTAEINRSALLPGLDLIRYLSIVDQVGVSTTLGLFGNSYLEGNIGYLKSRAHADRAGGTLRFVFPVSPHIALTAEGGINETMLDARGTSGRAVFGVEFSNFIRPKEFRGLNHPVPVDVPRIRYELLERRVRTGALPPVADAGPDQIGVPAGTITLNGSGSYDPQGETLTYQWQQVTGPAVSISGMNAAIATFTAEQGQTYVFRLTVKNTDGAQASARTTVTTTRPQQVQIIRFQASPAVIQAGQMSTIDWQVLNADTVTITPDIGAVDKNGGTKDVSPTQTTRYTLTATNSVSQATATTTIQVQVTPAAQFSACQVTPMNIMAGESATIIWATTNAQSVSISGIGVVNTSGSQTVTPTATTTYQLTATGATGTTAATCSVTLQVTPGALPRIIRFTAAPSTIVSGNTSTLLWVVENATTVTIDQGVGNVQSSGTSDVKPTANTTYTLTASNQFGQVTATTTVTVTPATPPPPPPPPPNPVTLTQCLASPATSANPGDPVTLTFVTQNATSISISGLGAVPGSPVVVRPTKDTTYTITAQGSGGPATCTISVTVTQPPPPPPPPPPGPVVVIAGGPVITTIYRQLTLDASGSSDPGGGPLIYRWESINTRAAIVGNPNTPTPMVELGQLFGDYDFRVTVTNQKGISSSAIVTVRFASTKVP